MSYRRALTLLIPAAAWILALGRPTAGAAQEPLTRCLEDAVSQANADGADSLQRQRRGFLLAGDIAKFSYELPASGCAGFLGVARRHGRDLDLRVYDRQGKLLARDQTRNAHPYVRACVTEATTVHVSVTLPDGDGEFVLVSLWHAPEELPGLEEVMASCTHAGQRRPGPIDIGPPPLGPPMGVALYRIRTRLRDLGYRETGQVLAGDLGWRGRDVRRLDLEADTCYAMVAVGDVTVNDIDLRVFGPGERPRLLVSDTTRRREAVAKLCTEGSGTYLLEVRMYDGAGRYALMALAMTPLGTPAPPGVDAATRLGFAELTARITARSFSWSQHTWMMVQPQEEHPIPVKLTGGRCYALAALSPATGGALGLSVTDMQGNLIANDMGLLSEPLLYHCPSEPNTIVHVWPRLLGGRRALPVLVMLATDTAAEATAPKVAGR